ncbi:MAG: aminodeoxychorismate synthase component I [Rhodospirillaceae bacterium]|nr:aminodeoxychorismate synthase component I [Rhodospirillaceae bacterium]
MKTSAVSASPDALPPSLALTVRPIAFRDPVAAFAPLAHEPFAILLDAAGIDPRARFAVIAVRPHDTVTLRPEDINADPFAALRAKLTRHDVTTPPEIAHLPFTGGAVGFIGYEIGGALEKLPPRKASEFPFDLAFGLYDVIAVFDKALKQAWVIATGLPETGEAPRAARAAARAEEIAAALGNEALPPVPEAATGAWSADLSQTAYERKVEAIIAYIRAGDIFQANMTQRWTMPRPALRDVDLYRRLRHLSPAPFGAYLGFGERGAIMSATPERFLSIDKAGTVETRPIKGTRPRGVTPHEDRRLADELIASAKDRAENLMIVDLLRNDLSRVCAAGSVSVPTLCGLESFAAVHHLVSVVTGRLRAECDALDALRVCFPGGSVTGAPKIRAMEIIHELEPVARGPYCGAIAWLGHDGAMDSAIVIRTLIRAGETLMAQAGGGIVADSAPRHEYAESLLKAGALLASVTGHHDFLCKSV